MVGQTDRHCALKLPFTRFVGNCQEGWDADIPCLSKHIASTREEWTFGYEITVELPSQALGAGELTLAVLIANSMDVQMANGQRLTREGQVDRDTTDA
ncbi:hypothetical protein [Acidocella sp. KAb 2-4]|uniref:hypothetical protein n=1 Tax=Acidocella sp. KAb 2-4 TaxID=2885158 RepID=UPI001D093165|nr:hypothetical protein [Acidocella sp. KAb 2-4]MCB5945253.1 hypothetical protein [Acidocella sp. KAb 2-4]